MSIVFDFATNTEINKAACITLLVPLFPRVDPHLLEEPAPPVPGAAAAGGNGTRYLQIPESWLDG